MKARAAIATATGDGILTARRLASMADYRVIPSIDQLLQRPSASPLVARFGRDATVEALRAAADGRIDPAVIVDLVLPLDEIADGYAALDARVATKVRLTI
jgi:threonine dehydrogenase-like Zn-dependent dehydrogenase